MSDRTTRGSALLPLTGALFVVLIVVSFLVGGETPDADASAREVVRYWTAHDGENMVGAVLEALGAVSLVFFGATLWRASRRWVDGSVLPVVALAGATVAAAGVGVDAAIRFAAADIADDGNPVVLQTFSAMWSNFFFPMVIGLATLILAASLAGWRVGVPKWLGVIGILIFIAFFTPVGFAAFLLSGLWIIVLSIILWLREARAAHAVHAEPAPTAVA